MKRRIRTVPLLLVLLSVLTISAHADVIVVPPEETAAGLALLLAAAVAAATVVLLWKFRKKK